jgi:glycosyltransferase involved in cell wall biosynthesis
MPLLTCITTVYNDGPVLFAAIDSLLSQSFADFELLVVDDGSNSESKILLEGISDPRVRLISQPNGGLSHARNTALRQMSGDYVCFLDSDDSRPDHAFEVISEVILRDDPDLVLCPGSLLNQRGLPLPFFDMPIFNKLYKLNPEGCFEAADPDSARLWALSQLAEPQSANKVVRADIVRRHGLEFPEGLYFEDILFHTKALAAAQRVSIAPSATFVYHQHYARPQITYDSGLRRFDVIPVIQRTLADTANPRWIDNTLYRSAVLASCLKISKWCEQSVSHLHKADFHTALQGALALANPRYRVFDRDGLLDLGLPMYVSDFVAEVLYV